MTENEVTLREKLIITILIWIVDMLARPIDKVNTMYLRDTISKELNIKI